ncbi:MAG: iron-containing alcohol dehydrogenase [Tepidanaerobacteraceae bacterium]|jgi:alcohol dehydrogenase class IV
MLFDKQYDVFTPKRIVTGLGCLKTVGEVARPFGKRALLVTDSVMEKTGVQDQVTRYLKDSGIELAIYNKVNEEPHTGHVEEGAKIFRENNCEFIISLGGGSPIDTGKAVGAVVTHDVPIRTFMGIQRIPGPNVPLIAIPTTAGTGSEVTRTTIITDKTDDVKMLIISDYIMPSVSICDAQLTFTAPKRLTAATGLDALTHAIEAYISQKAQPYTDIIALEAIRLISKYLRQAWSNGRDVEARYHMMFAATMAGLAFSNSSVCLVHGMSRPIGAVFHVPHGLSNAVLLPSVMRFTLPGNIEKFARIAEAMGESVIGLSTLEAAEKSVMAVEKLCKDLNMLGLRNAGVKQEDLKRFAPKMAKDAIASGSPANNPRVPTEEEIIQLYLEAY